MQELRNIKDVENTLILNQDNALIASIEAREIAQVQAAYVIAKKFPRNKHEARIKILEACKSTGLAEKAMYTYPRGGELISRPSIRLAEVAARSWGNLDFGIKQISKGINSSTMEAYAIDLETNARVAAIFEVAHIRETKKGNFKLTSERDIYETVANQGSRRLRSCILRLIDSDIMDDAVNQVKKTLESGEIPLSEQIKKMVSAFDEVGVKVEHLEKRLGHKLDAIVPQEIVTLKGIYRSLKDGFATREELFDIKLKNTTDAEETLEKILQEKKLQNVKKDIKYEKQERVCNDDASGADAGVLSGPH